MDGFQRVGADREGRNIECVTSDVSVRCCSVKSLFHPRITGFTLREATFHGYNTARVI